MKGIIIEKLDKKKHDRKDFDCGVEVLNLFLKTRANQEQNKRLNVTYVAVEQKKKTRNSILGYYTLSNSSLALYVVNPEMRRHIPPTYEIPSVKIGRLAVHKNFQSKGLGSVMLKDAFARIKEIALLVGIKGLEVVAKDEPAVQFYEKIGFVRLKDHINILFLPIETILNTIPETV